ncbi:tetratricopeptide repeat protein [uncultured Lacinutrix sp.]|uniref:tetratricopeptide repeat protein n=1 Tax=uncultured Lacinutrix sp. TaxID=574032 RepID=UPI0026103443|nr:tetratricopeptide repeat protein [uncultured Lacinutrix sp.]
MTNEDLLYGFFSNSLTETEEKQLFELLKTDANFKKQFEFENNLKQVIKHDESIKLKEKLKAFEAEIAPTNEQKNKSGFNWRIAASIVILLGASWFGYQSFFGVNYGDLYEANYQEYPNTEFAITRSDTVNSLERKAFVAYEAQDYESAVKLFENLPSNLQKPYINFYKAQAYLKIDSIDKAKTLFSFIINENTQFVAESHWYMAMIALKEKDKDKAKKYLRVLTENYDYNKAKAEMLLKKLN